MFQQPASISVASDDLEALYLALSRRLEQLVRMDVRAPEVVIEDACQIAWIQFVHHSGPVRSGARTGSTRSGRRPRSRPPVRGRPSGRAARAGAREPGTALRDRRMPRRLMLVAETLSLIETKMERLTLAACGS